MDTLVYNVEYPNGYLISIHLDTFWILFCIQLDTYLYPSGYVFVSNPKVPGVSIPIVAPLSFLLFIIVHIF